MIAAEGMEGKGGSDLWHSMRSFLAFSALSLLHSTAVGETQSVGKKILIGAASTVLGSLILWYFVPWLWRTFLIPCCEALHRFGTAFVHRLTSTAQVPWWVLWIFLGLSAIVLFLMARTILRRIIKTTRTERFPWLRFTELVYEGIRWVWRYGPAERVFDIVPLCPTCSYQLDIKHDARPNPNSLIGLSDVTIFWCDNCKEVKSQLDRGEKAVIARVHKEILRLINSGEWQNVADQQKATRSQNRVLR
jgi:hypothetical protein